MMQNVVVAIDSFKGSLTSLEAGNAVKRGVEKANPDMNVIVRPLADGGEGTVNAVTSALGGRFEIATVTGPTGKLVKCVYGRVCIEGIKTAVIELSEAAGLSLVPEKERNPMNTTTYGMGELIRHAIGKGCRNFIIGIGGSATNDGGIGMLQALGFGFLDKRGRQIPFGAKGIKKLVRITTDKVIPELADCTFQVACDVVNPLYGPKGASAVYGPQKGANPDMVKVLDGYLKKYADITKEYYPDSDPLIPGSGAAGGVGFCFSTFLNSELASGVFLILKTTRLEEYIREADLVVTGEGHMDFQTSMGKAPMGVAQLAEKYGKPVIAFAGGTARDASKCNETGIHAFFPILREVISLREAMDKEMAMNNLEDTAEQVFRLIRILGETKDENI